MSLSLLAHTAIMCNRGMYTSGAVNLTTKEGELVDVARVYSVMVAEKPRV